MYTNDDGMLEQFLVFYAQTLQQLTKLIYQDFSYGAVEISEIPHLHDLYAKRTPIFLTDKQFLRPCKDGPQLFV